MKTTKYLILLAIAALFTAACAKDEEKIYVSGLESSELVASPTSLVLTSDLSSTEVLFLSWTAQALQSSNPDIEIGDITVYTLQACLDEDFGDDFTVVESTESGTSKSYTGQTLNTLVTNLGAEQGSTSDVHFRLGCALGTNLEPVYSNTVTVSVTTYTVDMTIGYILDTAAWDPTGVTVYSENADGDYFGFIGATSWYNFYLEEGDGNVWGNVGEAGTEFYLSDDWDTMWNFWFPGQQGCYYCEFNTAADTPYWNSLYIPSLSLTGDLEGEMTYSRADNVWTYTYEASAAGSVTVQISGTGSLYNISTGTDDTAAIETPVAFTQNGDILGFGETAGDITLSVPASGECTLVIDLNDPKAWTAKIVSGEYTTTQIYDPIYLPGISDGSGDWTFDNILRLYDESSLSYAGFADIDSPWGYEIALESGNWDDVYQITSDDTESDAYSGTLVYGGGTPIPAPSDGGLYMIDVSLDNLTYALTKVDKVYITGFEDEWTLLEMTADADNTGVYTYTVTVSAETPWGFQIVLDTEWTNKFGGSDGKLLKIGGDNIPFSPTSGTYKITVDLIASTYEYEEVQ